MKIRPLEPCACPNCKAPINGTVTPNHPCPHDAIPFVVCAECGAILFRNGEGTLDLLRGDLPSWFRAEADRVRADAKERLSKLRRHLRRRPARAAVRAFEREAHCHHTVEAMSVIVEGWRERYPLDVPAFALPHRGLKVTSSLEQIGHRLARNQAARKLLEIWCELPRCPELAALGIVEPTVMMLRMCLEKERIPCESLSLTELGLGPRGGLN